MKSMRKQYGSEEGKKVFYASKNKGTIEGVEEEVRGTASDAMKALMKRTAELKAKKERAALMKANKERKDEETTSHPASAQSRLKQALGDRAYKRLSSRPNDPSPVEAARARRKKKKVEEGRVDEIAPVLVGIGRVAAGMVKRKAAKKAIASAQGVATGGDTAKKQAELGQQAASDRDLEETKMNNAYLNKLMESYGARKMTSDEKEGAKKLAAHGRGGPHDTSKKAKDEAKFKAGQKIFGKTKDFNPGAKKFRPTHAQNKKMDDHTEYHRIGFVMAEAMGLVEMEYKGASYIPKKRPDLENKPKLDIPKGSTLAKKTPLTKKNPGETTAQAIRRSAEEKGKAGKNPRG